MARYTVVGNHAIDGVKPGRQVEIDDDVKAERLITAGHIAPKARGKPAGDKPDDDGDEQEVTE